MKKTYKMFLVVSLFSFLPLVAAQDALLVASGDMSRAAHQTSVALTPVTLFPWLSESLPYIREKLAEFLSPEQLGNFDTAAEFLHRTLRAHLYDRSIIELENIIKLLKEVKITGKKSQKSQKLRARKVLLTALRSLIGDVHSAIKVLERRQRLTARGEDAFTAVELRHARLGRERSVKRTAAAIRAVSIIGAILLSVIAVRKIYDESIRVKNSSVGQRVIRLFG